MKYRALIAGGIAATTALVLSGCGGSGFEEPANGTADDGLTSSDKPLTVLYGASGDAEKAAVEDAVAAWSKESGIEVTARSAADLTQELSQGFASGSPADLFYLAPEQIAGYAENGSLEPYGDQLSNKDDFYPSLVENFTVDGEFYCAPKDFSTLALVINTEMWDKAGLTDADTPTTWDELDDVANKLASGKRAGLAFSPEYQRIGTFMAQAGGSLVSDEGKAVADSPENVDGLAYVQSRLKDGTFAYASDLGAGWGGEAFGKGMAAMTIEGNWITGALEADFPDVDYEIVPLPEGPAGKGTLQFTNCWGMAADSPNQQAALDLVEFLTSAEQQLKFSEAFGPIPSVESAGEQWPEDNPELTAFLDGADYATGIPTDVGVAEVISDFNAQLESLPSSDPAKIMSRVQGNLAAVVD